MIQHQLFYTGLQRQLHRLVVGRMSPAAKMIVLLRRVHRIVHEHAGVADEFDETISPGGTRVVFGARSQLVVRDIDERPVAIVLLRKSIAQGAPWMTDLIGAHFVTVSLTALLRDLGEVDGRAYQDRHPGGA